jgi:membrane protein DedA with SNARE-associated domain
MEFVFGWIANYSYVGIFGLLRLGVVGAPIPDETLLVFSGGHDPWPASPSGADGNQTR